jgi:hypothetical protein
MIWTLINFCKSLSLLSKEVVMFTTRSVEKLTHWFLVVCALGVLHARALGQEQVKPIVVSPLIGDTLDTAERDHYQLFPNLAGFEWAVFYLNPDSSLSVKVSLLEDGARRDTIISGHGALTALQDHIRLVAQKDVELAFEGEKEEGADVVLVLNNGRELKGELVSVRDSSVLIALSRQIKGVLAVKDTMISRVTVKGGSRVLLGMGLGLLGGAVVGGAIGVSAGGSEDPVVLKLFAQTVGGVVFGMAGAVVGTIVGGVIGANSKKDEAELYPSIAPERDALKKFARYPDKEPEFLQVIK